MKQVNLSRTEYSLLMLIRRVRLPPRAVAVLIADHFRRHKNYERLEIARIYQDSMESIEREERRNKDEGKRYFCANIREDNFHTFIELKPAE